ncbi:MAG TPA: Calx-beta domain-containing protein [Acidothermaceae bacterium]
MGKRFVAVACAAATLGVFGVTAGPNAGASSTKRLGAAATTAQQVAAGYSHTCALSGGGVECWGYGGYGQLGDGNTTDRANPVPVQGLASGIAQIAAGDYHTCAVKTSGAVVCWGNNGSGQLGNDSTASSSTPVGVTGLTSGVVAIAAGGNHTCALTSAGGVKCWGDDSNGQLGDGGNTAQTTPVNVTGLSSGVASIAAGESHTCAVTTSNAAKCWGDDDWGQLGNGSTNDYHVPKAVSGWATNAAQLGLGASHTCGVTTSGAAYCWGWTYMGQAGTGLGGYYYDDYTSPAGVSGLSSGVESVSAGGNTSCAVTTAGGAQCWGQNNYGQVGDGASGNQYTPDDVYGLTSGVSQISVGGDHTCALLTDHTIDCWGNNADGQVGDGSFNNRFTPVPVSLSGYPTPVAGLGGGTSYEGDAGSHTVSYPVTLSNPTTKTVTVSYKVFSASGNTATANVDYKATTGTLTFSATLSGLTPTVAFIPVTILGDTKKETNETYSVQLTSATNATVGTSLVTGTIFNDDPGTGIRATVTTNAIVEGNEVATNGGSNAMKFDLLLSKPVPSGKTVALSYTVTPGTATGCTSDVSGCDFLEISKAVSVTFTAGQQDKSFLVRTFADTNLEPNENFKVNLTKISGTAGATIENATGTGIIVNDD